MSTGILALMGVFGGAALSFPWYLLCERVLEDKYGISSTSWKFLAIVLIGWVVIVALIGVILFGVLSILV